MYHTDIIKLKERQKGLPMVVTLHDGNKIIDGLPGNVIILDQNNEMGHAFRLSNTPHVTDKTKYEMVSFKYNTIVHIRTNLSEDDIRDVLSSLSVDSVIDNSDVDGIMDSIIIKK